MINSDHTSIIASYIVRIESADMDRREELIDHYLTSYETKLENGITSDIALHDTLEELGILYQQHYKSTYKRWPLITAIVLLMAFMGIWSWHDDTSDHQVEDIAWISNWPTDDDHKQVSSHYGSRMHPVMKVLKQHNGIDIKAELGTPIIAPSAGVVMQLGFDQLNGNYMVIAHDDRYSTRYHHMQQAHAKLGDHISEGDVIGRVGNSGLSTAPHLHFEILEYGLPVDPMLYLAP